jgi:hypothetical protein
MRRKSRQVSAVFRALSSFTVRREDGATIITINIGGLTIVIKVPP